MPVRGGGPTHLAVHQGHLLTANYSEPGSVSVLSIGADGALGGLRSVLQHEGAGRTRERQQGPHAHAVQTDPSGRWAVSVDLGTDSVRVCELDAATGELEIERELGLRSGFGPRHLTFHPDGGHAYVMNELDSVVTVCRWDAVRRQPAAARRDPGAAGRRRRRRTTPRSSSSRPTAGSCGPPTAATTHRRPRARRERGSGSSCSTP